MRLSKRHRTRLEINMTPMIDVTFLLLIFFMTVNQVSKANREKMPLPPLAGSQDQSDAELIINIDREDNIIVSPNFINLNDLAAMLQERLQAAGEHPERLPVLIRVHRDADCRMVNRVMAMLERYKINRVTLGVEVPR
jgi:biopolymer transport protein ExbD